MTWFNDARSFYYNGHTYIGYLNRDGDCTARRFTNGGAALDTLVSGNRLFGAMEKDDHDAPGLLLRDSDKKILAFYSKHSGSPLYKSVSSSAEDVTAFAARVDLDSQLGGVAYTYPNPFQLTGEAGTPKPMYLFYRDPVSGSQTALRYSKSTDDGVTWAAQALLMTVSSRSAYWKIVQNGTDRFDFAFSDGSPVYDSAVSIYHFYYHAGNLYKTDGTLIGALGAVTIDTSNATLVYNGATVTSWVWDVAVDGTGKPYIVYTTYHSNDQDQIYYNYARWTGSAWATHEVVYGGPHIGGALGSFYAAGVCLDHSDPTKLFVSKQAAGEYEIFRYVTADGGSTWTVTQMTTGSTSPQFRPVSVRDHASDLTVIWNSGGFYTDYQTFSVGIAGSNA